MRYVLSVPLKLESLAELLQAQKLPHDWVIGAYRSEVEDHRPHSFGRPGNAGVGELSHGRCRIARRLVPRQHARGQGDLYTVRDVAAERLGARIAIPAATVNRGAWRTFALTATGVALALAMALGLAWFIGRRIDAPIASLAKATHAIGRGERLAVPSEAPIDEIARFAHTLQKSVDAMREREDRLRLALDAGRMGSWEWDLRTNRLAWSPEIEAIHGLPSASFAGTFDGTLLQKIHPDDRERVRAEWRPYSSAKSSTSNTASSDPTAPPAGWKAAPSWCAIRPTRSGWSVSAWTSPSASGSKRRRRSRAARRTSSSRCSATSCATRSRR